MSSSFAETHTHTAGLPAIVSISPITLPSLGRGVDLHVRVSLPNSGDTLPVVIFSHGNGQSFHAYGPLADYWATHGFAVIQPTHLDSRMLGLAPDDPRRPQFWRFREQDLAAVLDGLDRIENEALMIRWRLDHSRIAVAGHSWGAQTASTLLGTTHPDPDDGSVVDRKDHRVKAGVLLAPPGRGNGLTEYAARTYPFMYPDFSTMTAASMLLAASPVTRRARRQTNGHSRSSPSSAFQPPSSAARSIPAIPHFPIRSRRWQPMLRRRAAS